MLYPKLEGHGCGSTRYWAKISAIEGSQNLPVQAKGSISRAFTNYVIALFVWIMLTACTSGSAESRTPITESLQITDDSPPATMPDTLPTSTYPPGTATTPLPSNTPPTQAIYLPDSIPQGLWDTFQVPDGFFISTDSSDAEFRLDIWQAGTGTAPSITWWTYTLAAPFPTIPSEVSAQDLHSNWIGQPSGPFAGLPLLMDNDTLRTFSAWWGAPAEGVVQIVPPEELAETAWAQRPAWAILPFEALEPRWKVLSVDGVSPLQRNFDPSAYALSVPFALTSPTGSFDLNLPAGNRDASQLTIVDMTGVTALVRGTALWMERYGITYPAQDVGSILASADLTHISNEIPFTPDCPYPELYPTGMVFCSSPTYIDLLQAVGADIIELTGDHFSDWGPEAMYYTLSTYQDHNMLVYGGGINAEQARSATLVEHNGNKLAFIGCNIGCEVKPQVPCDALATGEQPGASQCDFAWLSGEITRLSNLGYQVIFTFQHREEYTYSATPILVDDFGQVARMGAVIVSGSQAHQPHGFAYQDRAFIHYGLGNLFFDQYHFCADFACDYAFIDRHIFYAGQHISTELIPIKFVDLARARLMTPEEAARFLQIIFTASGW